MNVAQQELGLNLFLYHLFLLFFHSSLVVSHRDLLPPENRRGMGSWRWPVARGVGVKKGLCCWSLEDLGL
ncbi:hypothetical protein HZ326_8231 [Fusarium oxysporum f. sp. albedinis]|nr:hypothetical protein HZ326_8231 [Fusarium oxysporum f. sp. albedinis]